MPSSSFLIHSTFHHPQSFHRTTSRSVPSIKPISDSQLFSSHYPLSIHLEKISYPTFPSFSPPRHFPPFPRKVQLRRSPPPPLVPHSTNVQTNTTETRNRHTKQNQNKQRNHQIHSTSIQPNRPTTNSYPFRRPKPYLSYRPKINPRRIRSFHYFVD